MANADELRQRLRDGANSAMNAAVIQIFSDLLRAVPQRSGELFKSGYTIQTGDAPRITWTIGFLAPQAEWTEYGVEPHGLGQVGTLRHWFDEQTGEDVFRVYTGWEVSMPARPWFHPTIEADWPGAAAANLDAGF